MSDIKKHKVDISPEQRRNFEDVSIDLATLDSSNIDFDLSALDGIPHASAASRIQSINPVKAFSQHVDIDLNKLNKAGLITPNSSNTLLSNAFRKIKRPILNNIAGKGATKLSNANLIMLTSSVANEGKTFSSINLAISIAMEQDKNVLLIDADINKPSHFKIFGIDNKPGLTDVLLNEVSGVSDVLCKTNIPSLSLMSAGQSYDYSTELLASEAMDDFVDEISTRYSDRIIIFDSPPLLPTTEASVLAAHMGQVIMVVEAESTENIMLRKSLDLLSNEIVLLMLNKQREKNQGGKYGYGYGYE